MKIKPEDHPDIAGNWIWTALEIRWIEERIAEAVKAEREACAKVCEDLDLSDWQDRGWDQGTYDCANAIRARGQQ